MSATKRPSRPVVQRVARNLIRRGGSYTFRMRIPPEARGVFGGITEYVRSFGDVTEKEAKRLTDFHRAYCNGLIAEARGKAKSKKGAIELIRIKRVPDRDEIERAVRAWLVDREAGLGTSLYGSDGHQKVRVFRHIEDEVIRVGSPRTGEMPMLTRWIAEGLAEANGWKLPPDGELRRLLEDRVGRAQYEFSKRISAEQEIGKVHQPTHPMFAPGEYLRDSERQKDQSPPVSMQTIFSKYLAERKPPAKTVKKWTTAINSLVAHLGHDNAAAITPEDIVAWKDALLAPGEGGKVRTGQTVRNGYIGPVKTVMGYGKRNRLIADNPAAGITAITTETPRNRIEQGYSDAEARQVLAATLAVDTHSTDSFGLFARRWLPWLCAFTGARVGEMAQLRREDVAQDQDGNWFVVIKPEAGSQKGNFARQVSIHPQLIEQGFVEAVKQRSGPLFYDPTKGQLGSTGNTQYAKAAQRVAYWVRDTVGIKDKALQPNHGWRHRFVTVAHRIGMPDDVCRAIIGHAARDVHQTYGNVPFETISHWISLLPRYEFNEAGSMGVPHGSDEILQPVATAAE